MSKLTYHELNRSERDFLTAVAQTPADATGIDVSEAVRSLRRNDRRPNDSVTYTVLPELVAYGLVYKADRDGRGDAYQLTEDGYQVLRDASDEIAP